MYSIFLYLCVPLQSIPPPPPPPPEEGEGAARLRYTFEGGARQLNFANKTPTHGLLVLSLDQVKNNNKKTVNLA